MFPAARFAALAALLHSGAIFGFFFAWVCSTMWGLDRLPADVAIAAILPRGSVSNRSSQFLIEPSSCPAACNPTNRG